MARLIDSITYRADGTPLLPLSKGRAAAVCDALRAAMDAGLVDKRHGGVITSLADLCADVADGAALDHDQHRWVYLHASQDHPDLCKIGYTRDLSKRLSRSTDSPSGLHRVAAWQVANLDAARAYEAEAERLLPKHTGTGGSEWFAVSPADALAVLQAAWGNPDQ